MAYTSLSFAAHPPHIHLSTPTPISQPEALAHIQTYLDQTSRRPYLHPDAIFTDTGIPTSATNDKTGGLVLHQLRRVEKGLRGEVLGIDTEFAGLNGSLDVAYDDPQPHASSAPLDMPVGGGEEPDTMPVNAQDPFEDGYAADDSGAYGGNYQQQLGALGFGTVEGEIGNRNNVITDRDGVPKVHSTPTTGKRKAEEFEGTQATDKEARKRAKKEKRHAQKREKELARSAAKHVATTSHQATTVANAVEDEQQAYEDDIEVEFGAAKSPDGSADSLTDDVHGAAAVTQSNRQEKRQKKRDKPRESNGTAPEPSTAADFYETKEQGDGISQVEENGYREEKTKKKKKSKKHESKHSESLEI